MAATPAVPWSRSIAQAYGLRLRMDDSERNGEEHPDPAASVRVNLDATPDWAAGSAPALRFQHPRRARNGEPLLHWHQFGAGRHSLRYADNCQFFLDVPQRALWAKWPAAFTDEDAATYLFGPVLGFFLRLLGKVSLHASVVMCDGRCLAFVGAAGAGKSTIAAAFAQLGQPVLTEDVACLDESDGGFAVRPGYPLIRLWKGSEQLLPRNGGELPPLTPNWDKRYLPLDNDRHRFHARPEPLAAIYLLRAREAMAVPARISPLTGQEALSLLVANTHANYLLDRDMQAREFEVLGRLTRAVPIHALTLCADGSRLMEAVEWLRRQATAETCAA